MEIQIKDKESYNFIPLQLMNDNSSWYVVTGASSGIGYELVVQLCKNPGIRVLAVARSEDKLMNLKKQAGDQCAVLVADLDKDGVASVLNYFKENKIDQLQGIVNNAGYLVNKSFAEITKSDLEKSYAVNVFAPYLLTQSLIPLLKKSNASHVVNISSMGGVQGSVKFPGLSAYSSGKGALAILSECLALELSADKIFVNCLALGSVQTEMLAAAFPGYDAPLKPAQMGEFVAWFLMNGQKFFNGKIIPVALSTP